MEINPQTLLDYYSFTAYHDQLSSWVVGAIIGAATLASALINNRARRKQDARNNAANLATSKELAKYSFEQEQAAIDRQNLYNDPKNQMQRFQGAGLNPNLIYGSGSGSAGNQASSPSYDTPKVDQSVSPVQIEGIPQMLGIYQDYQMRQAQIDNVKAQTANTNERTQTESVTRFLQDVRGKTGKFELGQKEYLAPYQAAITGNKARASEATLLKEWQSLRNLSQDEQLKILVQRQKEKGLQIQDIDAEKKQAELIFQRYKNEWAKAGITSGDNIMLRMLVRMMNESGFSMENVNPFGK